MKNLGLKAKLYVLSGFLLFMCALTGAVGYYVTHSVVGSYRKIDEFNMPNVRIILSAQSVNRSMRIQLLQLLSPGLSKEMKEATLKKYYSEWERYDELIKEYLAAEFGPGEKELYAKLEPEIANLHKLTDKAADAFKAIKDEHDEEGYKKYTKILLEDVEAALPSFREHQEAIAKYHIEAAKVNSKEATEARELGIKILFGLVALAMIIGITFALSLSSSLVKIFNEISKSLTQSGEEVSSAASQVAASSEELSQAVHEQAAALQETASSLEELSSTIAKNTDISKQAAESSKRTQESAEHGKNVVEEMIHSMDEINNSNENIIEQINQSNQKISHIVEVITEIGNKTKVINDIVFQTKLLSFNASVEAARAGEQGKGFAVVAEEVGNLARMSGSAATEISEMLDESIRSVTTIVQESQSKVNSLIVSGKEKVSKGTSIANECGRVFNQIYDDITLINNMSSEISVASTEQTSGVQEISRAMNQLEQATQQNSSVSQQAASAAEQLSAQAVSMKASVHELIKVVGGASEVKEVNPAVSILTKKRKESRPTQILQPLEQDKRFIS